MSRTSWLAGAPSCPLEVSESFVIPLGVPIRFVRCPMWTAENRPRYNRDKLRYPSDLTDAEWAHIEPLIPPARRGGGKRRVNIREVVNGGCPARC